MVSLEVKIDNEKIYNYHKAGFNNKTLINHSILISKMWKHCYKYYIESLLKNNFLN